MLKTTSSGTGTADHVSQSEKNGNANLFLDQLGANEQNEDFRVKRDLGMLEYFVTSYCSEAYHPSGASVLKDFCSMSTSPEACFNYVTRTFYHQPSFRDVLAAEKSASVRPRKAISTANIVHDNYRQVTTTFDDKCHTFVLPSTSCDFHRRYQLRSELHWPRLPYILPITVFQPSRPDRFPTARIHRNPHASQFLDFTWENRASRNFLHLMTAYNKD
jgi:hypothetical protein